MAAWPEMRPAKAPGGGINERIASRTLGRFQRTRLSHRSHRTVSGRRASLKSTYRGRLGRTRGSVSTSSWLTWYTGTAPTGGGNGKSSRPRNGGGFFHRPPPNTVGGAHHSP